MLLSLPGVSLFGEEVLFYSESFGTVSSNTSIAAHSFDNEILAYSGTGDIRGTTSSSGYETTSGEANVFLGSGQYFQVEGLNTSSFSAGDLRIGFGAYKSLTALDMTDLVFSYSVDGDSFSTIVLPVQPTGSGTANWRFIGPLEGLPSTESLWLKWEHTGGSGSYRLDDIQIHVVPEPAVWGLALGLLSGLLICLRKRKSLATETVSVGNPEGLRG